VDFDPHKMMIHIPTTEEIKEERRQGELRRMRIVRENELMKEKIARTNKVARSRIETDFKRRCRAVEARQKELEERGLRLTEHSPFKVDMYKQIAGVSKVRKAKENRKEAIRRQKKAIESMTGKPGNNPITNDIYDKYREAPLMQNALDVRKHRESLRTLVREYNQVQSMADQELERIRAQFPIVAMIVEKNLNEGVPWRPPVGDLKSIGTG
jgi:hypothetical protein